MSSAAQLEMEPRPEMLDVLQAAGAEEFAAAEDGFVLKQQVAERLAAHRARRHGANRPAASAQPGPVPVAVSVKGRAGQIAAAVAERYANSPSYRTFLAAEAENAIRQAAAAAEVAAVTAKAVAAAQYSLLAELEEFAETLEEEAPVVWPHNVETAEVSHTAGSVQGITVRMYEEARLPSRPSSLPRTLALNAVDSRGPMDEEERLALDEEIAFRQSPSFDEMTAPVEIAANLIEFPRQLVAARKARPRYAEGPLREDGSESHDSSQLRIFEVEQTQLSAAPAEDEVAPVWTSIMLGAQPAPAPFAVREGDLMAAPVLEVAAMELRLMAAAVDGCIVAAATILFAGVFAWTAGPFPSGTMTLQNAAIGFAGAGTLLGLLYQVLCFALSNQTAGMRYARIGFCTFSDENPTRKAMRRRILALIFSVCPLGIGVLWAWLDGDGLGWHDRISRMYQRSY